jgi:1-hydroxycarotenoid 3,4-desaturase
VLFPENYLEEFADMFDRQRPPQDPTVYLCAQEVCHGREGWPEHEPLFVMANAPALAEESNMEANDESRELRARLDARMKAGGLIDADDAPVWTRTPEELARRFRDSRGSIYGAASNDRNAAFKRPGNVVKRLPGLYLASGSAHPGGGVPLAALSGRIAARAVVEMQPLEERR